MDACADPGAVRAVAAAREGTVCVSALTGEGLAALVESAAAALAEALVPVVAVVPYAQVSGGGRARGSAGLQGAWGTWTLNPQ